MSTLPTAVRTAKLYVAGFELEVVHQDDGRRVITADTAQPFFDALCSGEIALTQQEVEAVGKAIRDSCV
jgi:hypothetical protein